jgi:hypothetical protein
MAEDVLQWRYAEALKCVFFLIILEVANTFSSSWHHLLPKTG